MEGGGQNYCINFSLNISQSKHFFVLMCTAMLSKLRGGQLNDLCAGKGDLEVK